MSLQSLDQTKTQSQKQTDGHNVVIISSSLTNETTKKRNEI